MKNVTSPYEPLVIVSGADISTSLGLSRAAYVDLALLMGTDFTDRIKNIGPVTAYHFIKKYGSIERVVESIRDESRYTSEGWEKYLARVNIARLLFTTLPPLPPVESLRPIEKNDKIIQDVWSRYGLKSSALEKDWDYDTAYQVALGGNYFDDTPSAS